MLSDRFDGDLAASAVIDALPRAIVVTDLEGVIRVWNRKAEQLYGWTEHEVLGRPVGEVLVSFASDEVLADEVRAIVRSGEVWSGDFTVLRRDGDPVRVWVTGRPIVNSKDEVVAILGASEDVTEQRLLEQRAADLAEHLDLALEAGGLGTFRWDLATGVTEWDARTQAQFGFAPGSFDGAYETWVHSIHPDDRDEVMRRTNEAVAARGSYSVEHRVVWPDGSVHWLHGAGQVTVDEAGTVTGTIGCTRDITDQVVAQRERERLTLEAIEAAEHERLSRERLEFLSSMNDALAASHNREEIMVNVARTAVPRLGDWCSVYVLPFDGSPIPDVEIAHVDPAMVQYARELQTRFPYDPNATTGMAEVIRTGTSQFLPIIDDAVLDQLDAPDEAVDVIHELVLHSAIAVPFVKRGRVLGALQLVMSKSRRHYTEDDLTLAEAVAARIAASLDNRRLADEQRAIATALQASLLPAAIPAIPGVDVAVRYWANGDGVEVGGDFYDVFQVAQDRWAVVIGDVCGTGPTAAAVTGMARHTIASSAWHGDDPSRILQNLNRAMRERQADRFCTVLYGSLASTPGGADLTFACGGHPLPIVVRSDGSAATHGAYGSLVGVFDEIDVTTTDVALRAGDTVVFYTDGATDVPPPHGLSERDFTNVVAQACMGAGSAEDVAEQLHLALSSILNIDDREDDIALLIVRVRSEAKS
jgi:PAS domain S-box-containing protein